MDREQCFQQFLEGPASLLGSACYVDIDGKPTTWYDALFGYQMGRCDADMTVGLGQACAKQSLDITLPGAAEPGGDDELMASRLNEDAAVQSSGLYFADSTHSTYVVASWSLRHFNAILPSWSFTMAHEMEAGSIEDFVGFGASQK